ncbi:hypothetical protein ACVXG9_16270 [Escherichia coli]
MTDSRSATGSSVNVPEFAVVQESWGDKCGRVSGEPSIAARSVRRVASAQTTSSTGHSRCASWTTKSGDPGGSPGSDHNTLGFNH